jgi:hypothetical protein
MAAATLQREIGELRFRRHRRAFMSTPNTEEFVADKQ